MKRIRLGYLAGAIVMLAVATVSHAAVFTWDGSESSLWSVAGNWVENVVPPNTGLPADQYVLAAPGAGNLGLMYINGNRAMTNLTFNSNIGASNVLIRLGTTSLARTLSFTFLDTVFPTLDIASAVSGNITIGDSATTQGNISLVRNLTVNHNGSGTLTFWASGGNSECKYSERFDQGGIGCHGAFRCEHLQREYRG